MIGDKAQLGTPELGDKVTDASTSENGAKSTVDENASI
jgi:hypothetical protein